MEIKLIDNPVKLAEFLNDASNTGNIVDVGDKYFIKPDALYLGVYEGIVLAGVFEVRRFWHNTIECHNITSPDFRGKYSLEAHRLFCRHACEFYDFDAVVTFVPEKTKYGRVIISHLGARRVGTITRACTMNGEKVDAVMYEMTREQFIAASLPDSMIVIGEHSVRTK